jgi:putative endonuclease
MAQTEKQVIGETGEGIAARFLMKQDFVIRHRNYRKKWGEIDIVAQKGKDIRFVEVKTVSHPKQVGESKDRKGYFRPEENIHPYKLKRLHRAIETYLMEHNVSHETNWQLDAAIVYLDFSTHKAKVDYIENII